MRDYTKLSKKELIKNIKKDNIHINSISEEFRDDYDVVLEIVKKNKSPYFKFASHRLRDDKKLVLHVMKINGINLKYISERLMDDEEVVLEAVKQNGKSLYWASERIRDTKSIVLEGVKNNGWVLSYASKRLQNDKELVLTAMNNDVLYLYYSSEKLQDDKELLELLEKKYILLKPNWMKHEVKWYEKRMEILENIREKELMENNIIKNNIYVKKNKF